MTSHRSSISHMHNNAERPFQGEGLNSTIAYLESLLQVNPVNSIAHFYLGKFYLYTLKEYDLAESHLRLALKFNPPCPDAFIELGQVLIQKRNFREAELTIQQGLNYRHINKSNAYELLGKIYERSGKPRLAKKFCKEANRPLVRQSLLLTQFRNVRRSVLRFFLF